MTGVTVTFTRDPSLVRTVRLVAAAVARRAHRDEEFVEEIRLAVGEACGLLATGTPVDPGADEADAVTVRMCVGATFTVEVSAVETALEQDPSEDAPLDRWTLLRGLVESFEVQRGDGCVALHMTWPPA